MRCLNGLDLCFSDPKRTDTTGNSKLVKELFDVSQSSFKPHLRANIGRNKVKLFRGFAKLEVRRAFFLSKGFISNRKLNNVPSRLSLVRRQCDFFETPAGLPT